MTTQKSFKRLVRVAHGEDRRELHGGARDAARRRRPGPAGREPPRRSPTSDEAIRERTGRGWEEWFDLLDDWGAAERTHRETARWVAEQQGIAPARLERPGDGGQLRAHARPARRSASTPTASRSRRRRPSRCRSSASTTRSSTRRSARAGCRTTTLRERTATRPLSARFDWGDDGSRVTSRSRPRATGGARRRCRTSASPTPRRRSA